MAFPKAGLPRAASLRRNSRKSTMKQLCANTSHPSQFLDHREMYRLRRGIQSTVLVSCALKDARTQPVNNPNSNRHYEVQGFERAGVKIGRVTDMIRLALIVVIAGHVMLVWTPVCLAMQENEVTM